MWTTSIKLVTDRVVETDKDGFDTVKESYVEGIPASITDTTRNDELVAMQQGYTADCNIEIAACNYNGEHILYDEGTGERYEAKRTFRSNKSKNIILTCERRE